MVLIGSVPEIFMKMSQYLMVRLLVNFPKKSTKSGGFGNILLENGIEVWFHVSSLIGRFKGVHGFIKDPKVEQTAIRCHLSPNATPGMKNKYVARVITDENDKPFSNHRKDRE